MKEDKKVPNIRFPGFTNDWEQRKLDDVLEVLKDGTHGTHADVDNGVYLLSAKNIKNGCVSIDESDRQISFEEYEKIHTKFKLKNGDVLMTIVGTIGEAAILESAENITFQRSVAFLRPSNELQNSFLLQTIYTKSFQKELDNRKATGAQPGIYLGEVAQIPIMIPTNLSEQEKISSYFDNLDNLITLHQRKCDKIKELKLSMLQKMFPRNGEMKPEIRFPEFTDDWEQRKLEDVTSEFKSGSFIAAAEIEETGEYPVYGGNGLRGYSETYNHDGEFALIGRQGALCGNMNYSTGKAYFTEHAVAVKANDLANTKFLYYLLDKMNLGQYSDQSAQPGLAVGKIIKLKNMFPSKEEQDRIGDYFTNFDHLITLHQRKCEELKKIKQSMLQKMFL